MSDSGKFYISQNEEWFSQGPFSSREDAISEGKAVYAQESFYVGRSVAALDLVTPDIDGLIENMECNIYDHVSFDDGPVLELSEDRKAELQKIVEDFIRQHASVTVFAIIDVEEIHPEELEITPAR